MKGGDEIVTFVVETAKFFFTLPLKIIYAALTILTIAILKFNELQQMIFYYGHRIKYAEEFMHIVLKCAEYTFFSLGFVEIAGLVYIFYTEITHKPENIKILQTLNGVAYFSARIIAVCYFNFLITSFL